jgi:hypothetical protein
MPLLMAVYIINIFYTGKELSIVHHSLIPHGDFYKERDNEFFISVYLLYIVFMFGLN